MKDIYNRFSIINRAKITYNLKQGNLFMRQPRMMPPNRLNQLIEKLSREEERIKNFRKNPTHGSQIFRCAVCNAERIYGHSCASPELKNPLILCEGVCKKHTIHIFVRVHLGREEKCLNFQ